MPVIFDAQSGTDITGNAVSSFSDSVQMTVGSGANRGMICLIGWGTAVGGSKLPTNISLTWGGQALTLIANTVLDNPSVSAVSIYGLLNPASGTQTFAGSWTGNFDFTTSLVAFTNVDQTSFATSFINGTTTTGGIGTASVAITSNALDYVAGVFSNFNTFGAITSGIQVYIDNTPASSSGAGLRSPGAASVTLGIGSTSLWTAAGVDVVFGAASSPTTGGTVMDAGTTFRRTFHYQSIAQPIVFTTAATPYAGWDDTLEWPRPAQPRSSIYSAPFIAQVLGAFQGRDNPEDWTNWPDFAPGRPRVPLHQPWSFVPSPAQVFFPYAPWDDFTRRKPQPLDTQPLAWPPTPVATPFPAMGWISWPDFAFPKRKAIDTPLSFVPLVPSATVLQDWADFIPRKKAPLNYDPLAFVPVVVAQATWNAWANWPDIVPTRKRPVADFIPWSFIPTPAQVFFPYAPWDDFTRRKPQYPDTQPLAWTGQTIATPAPTMAWVRWPDFAPKKPSAADLWPLAFVPLVPSATVLGDWPDFVRRKPQPLDTQPLSWTGQTIAAQQVWFPYDPWPSFINKKPVSLNFTPATPFIQTPAQVWFPYGPWDDFVRRARPSTDPQSFAFVFAPQATYAVVVGDWPDFARRKPQPLDTQPLVWNPFTPAPTLFFVPTNWPDFAPKARPLVDLRPWSFIQSPAQVFFPYGPWDDFTRRKPSPLIYPPTALVPIHVPSLGYLQWPDFATKKRPPLNYIPLTFVQTIRTPWNELSRWPEMVPIRSKAGLHAALQQFLVRFPGTITQATITGILNAFEVNSDIASITILVRQSGPAVRAAVSIQEIGTI